MQDLESKLSELKEDLTHLKQRIALTPAASPELPKLRSQQEQLENEIVSTQSKLRARKGRERGR